MPGCRSQKQIACLRVRHLRRVPPLDPSTDGTTTWLRPSRESGFALLDTLVSFILIVVVLWAGTRFIFVGSAHVGEARIRTVASSLANEHLELIRNRSYASIGLAALVSNPWYPSEPIVTASPGITQDQTITRYGIAYRLRTYVTYVDSPTDGLGAADADGTQDYKRVFVTVDWSGAYQIRMSTLVTQ